MGDLDLSAIKAGDKAPNPHADRNTSQEKAALMGESLLNSKADREARKEYSSKLYRLICFWLIVVAGLVVLDGFGKVFGFFDLSDAVMMTLLGGTTLNVLGLFVVVARYLFSEKRIR